MTPTPHTFRRTWCATRPAFTLVELMVAVAIFVLVILGVGKIFGTIGRVTTVGEANGNIMQGLPAIERQMRRDLAGLSHDGFMVLRHVLVPNDIRGSTPNLLLDPTLGPNATFRCDQLLFFANGRNVSAGFAGSYDLENPQNGANAGGNQQATVARIYYGHAYQIPADRLPQGTLADAAGSDTSLNGLLTPWAYEPVGSANLDLVQWPNGTNLGAVNGTQPRPAEWIVARQAVLLADDGGGPTFFYSNVANSSPSIWLNTAAGDWVPPLSNPWLRNSRVDIAASQVNDIRRRIQFDGSGNFRPWIGADGQRSAMLNALFYPRAERLAPTMYRADQFLVSTALASGVRSMAIEWTMADGVGRVTDENGVVGFDSNTGQALLGMYVPATAPQPWFGMHDDSLGTITLGEYFPDGPQSGVRLPLYPGVFQTAYTVPGFNGASAGISVVETVFGLNQDQPLDAFGAADPDLGYTPWPTALRVTLLVGDPRGRSEVERPVQFVIDLPSR
ncbi:MAG: prepilin-type N-terminal cleavage/methylation domain-containing protein [Phycisphaerales bacterium]|nr:prepilin-type N-terminal cleavage/methylation domain-containing protein [Phycisphaerales bacterium]